MKNYRYFFGKRLDKTAFHALIVSARPNEVTQAETKTSNHGEQDGRHQKDNGDAKADQREDLRRRGLPGDLLLELRCFSDVFHLCSPWFDVLVSACSTSFGRADTIKAWNTVLSNRFLRKYRYFFIFSDS